MGVSIFTPRVGDWSPWGTIETVRIEAIGIAFVSTSSHGGFWLAPCRIAEMSEAERAYADRWSRCPGGQWWEEDCASAYVVRRFADQIAESYDQTAEALRDSAAGLIAAFERRAA